MKHVHPLAIAAAAAAILLGIPQAGFSAAPAPGSAAATVPTPPRRGARRRTTLPKVFQELGLSEDQKTQILAIIVDQRAQVKALRQDATLSARDRSAKIAAVTGVANQKIAVILGPEKTQELNKLRVENAADARLKRMTTELGLSEGEQKQLRALFIDEGTQLQALQENTMLSAHDRGVQRRAIGREFTEKILAVLTPDQKAKLEASRHRTKQPAAIAGGAVPSSTAPKP